MARTSILVAGACAILVSSAAWAAPPADALPYPSLPEPIASFGAAVGGDYLYVFSGANGRSTGNSVDRLSQHFTRLNLTKPGAAWESLTMHHPAQSNALLAWGGNIYRVGGLSYKDGDQEGTKAGDFDSTTHFSKYDPKKNAWTDLPPLPEGRSSLDAAVLDDKIYVVGGWNLQGSESRDAPWHETALVFDLKNEQGEWKEIAKPPFTTRALAVAAFDHKLWVLGGMTRDNFVTRGVHVYDPKTNEWTKGPELVGDGRLTGFAVSAFASGGKLYYNGLEGVLHALNADGSGWEPAQRLMFARYFHRLLPMADGKLLAVAGVSRAGRLANVEVINLADAQQSGPKVTEWSVKFGGRAKHSQGLIVNGNSLYAFGGNASRAPHDFSKEAFVNEAIKFDLLGRTAEALPPLPMAIQSPAVAIAGSSRDSSIYVLGGLTYQDDQFRSSAAIQRYRLRSENWSDETVQLPASRSMFDAVTQGDAIWMFGGAQAGAQRSGLALDTWRWSAHGEDAVEVVKNAALPVRRRSFGGCQLEGDYYMVGGLGGDSGIVGSMDVYNFESGKWRQVAAPRHPRVFPSLVAAAGKLYLAGGFAKVDGHFSPAESVEVYDPQADKWSTAWEQPPLKHKPAVMVAYQDRLLFYGVDEKEDGLAHIAIVDPSPATPNYGPSTESAEGQGGFGGGGDSAETVARLMRMDANGDGKLSGDEVGERMQRFIGRADANKDGLVTKEEIEAMLQQDAAAGGSTGGNADGNRGGQRPGRPANGAGRGASGSDGQNRASGPARAGSTNP